jgi:hypothetical protein
VFDFDSGAGFREMVAPFHGLQWAEDAVSGGPMPGHPWRAITLYCSPNAYADFARIRLLRPRATSLNHGDVPLYCLGGRVMDFKPGQSVQARMKGRKDVRSVIADQRGWFCFSKMPPGIYTVWTDTEAGKIIDRRGPSVELRSDVMSLLLNRRDVAA